MADLKEQCVRIKICFLKWEKHSMETFKMLKVSFGEQKMGTQVSKWFSKFKSSVTSTADAECCSGCTLMCKTDENMDRVKDLVHKNRRITIPDVTNM
jgi:hypothetical protein